jgi:hypothetical protein
VSARDADGQRFAIGDGGVGVRRFLLVYDVGAAIGHYLVMIRIRAEELADPALQVLLGAFIVEVSEQF